MSFGIGTRTAIDVGLGGVIAFATNPWGGSAFARASAAYSVRIPANSIYNGPLLRVRRSSDNTEQNIGVAGAQVAQNRNFALTTGWTFGSNPGANISISGGALVFNGLILTLAGQNMGLTPGKTYNVTILIDRTTADPSTIRCTTSNSPATEGTNVSAFTTVTGLQVSTVQITANAPCLVFASHNAICNGAIYFVSVQEATQQNSQDGWLDERALMSFVGTGSGYVTTWYDQVNGLNATQTTGVSQPRIVNAGVVETAGGIPATVFDGTQVMTAPVDFPSAFTVNWVGQTTADVGFQMFVSKTDGAANHPFDMWTLGNTNIFISDPAITVFFLPGNGFAVSSGRSVWTFQGALGAGNVNGWRNNASLFAPATATVYSSVSSLFYIGQRGGGGTTLIGNIQEITCFDVLTATNPRQTLERNQGTAFGITVA